MEELNQNSIVELNVPATDRCLRVIDSVVRAMVEHISGLADRENFVSAVELAVHEACANIVEHAYEWQPGRIRAQIRVQQEPQQVIIDLFDSGKSVKKLVPGKLDQARTDGGYGLILVFRLMDEVLYEPRDPGNHLRLIKYIKLEQGSQNGDYSRSG